MLLTFNLQHALAILDSPRLIREEVVVPASFPPHSNSPYRAGYDWLYQYERDIVRFLTPWFAFYRYELIGEKGILCEAFSNAFCHGHQKDPRRPIKLKVFQGRQGMLIQIADDGPGFYVKKVIRRYLNNQRYYSTAGNGIHLMAASKHFGIFFNRSGTNFHLLYLFDEGLQRLPAFAFYSLSDHTDHHGHWV